MAELPQQAPIAFLTFWFQPYEAVDKVDVLRAQAERAILVISIDVVEAHVFEGDPSASALFLHLSKHQISSL